MVCFLGAVKSFRDWTCDGIYAKQWREENNTSIDIQVPPGTKVSADEFRTLRHKSFVIWLMKP
jgi:hypothetical protein